MNTKPKEKNGSEKRIIKLYRTNENVGYKRWGIPLREVNDATDVLHGKFGSYPLYAFFLYSEFDVDLAEFIKLRGQWLHSLSGDDCLVGVFENPREWGDGWERYWKEKLGSDFNQISAEWRKLELFNRNTAFVLAERLGVGKNTLPCIVFVESFSKKKVMCIPIIADKNHYPKYFQDIFTAVETAAKAPAGARLSTLRSEWRKIWGSRGWVKWILPERIKDMATSIQEWGSVINNTKNAIVSALNPFAPLLQQLKDIFANKS